MKINKKGSIPSEFGDRGGTEREGRENASNDDYTKAAIMLQSVKLKIVLYPTAWDYICNAALQEGNNNRRFSFRRIMEQARWKYFTGTDGTDFTFSNDEIPAFARLFKCQYPEPARWMEIRPSRFDRFFSWGKGGDC